MPTENKDVSLNDKLCSGINELLVDQEKTSYSLNCFFEITLPPGLDYSLINDIYNIVCPLTLILCKEMTQGLTMTDDTINILIHQCVLSTILSVISIKHDTISCYKVGKTYSINFKLVDISPQLVRNELPFCKSINRTGEISNENNARNRISLILKSSIEIKEYNDSLLEIARSNGYFFINEVITADQIMVDIFKGKMQKSYKEVRKMITDDKFKFPTETPVLKKLCNSTELTNDQILRLKTWAEYKKSEVTEIASGTKKILPNATKALTDESQSQSQIAHKSSKFFGLFKK